MGGMNMNAMLRQAQKMQSDMENARRELDEKEYEFASGGGEVHAVVNGKFECVKLTISPEVIDPDDARYACGFGSFNHKWGRSCCTRRC